MQTRRPSNVPNDVGEECSHLLDSASCPKYGIKPSEHIGLLEKMVHTPNEIKSEIYPQYIAALSAAGGAFAAGTLLGWTSPAQIAVSNNAYGFEISKEEFSWIGSAMTLGAASVCIPIGFLMNLIGRKLTMLMLVLPFTIGWAMLIWAQNITMLYASRFILGVSGGAFCVTAPIYTAEIAQKDIRGALGSFFQLMVTVGILFVYVIGAELNIFWTSVFCGAIPIIFGAIFIFMPESPTYLVGKTRNEAAIKSIQFLRGREFDYNNEIEDLKLMQEKIKVKRTGLLVAITSPTALKALGISIGLMLFQQLSGINAVIFYSNQIFEDANTGIDSKMSTIVVGVMQVIATFTSTLVVDKLGRRILLLLSGTVMALSTIAMGAYFYLQSHEYESIKDIGWLPISSLCIFIIMFSIGYGPVPWLMMGELFATDIKEFAGSIAGTTNWLLAFIVTKTFVNLKNLLGSGETFWLFSAISIVGVMFVYFFVPETKGKSLNEIQKELMKNNHKNELCGNNTVEN